MVDVEDEMEKEEKMKANSENLLWHGVPHRRAGEMLGVKAKTLHNRISRGDFREGEDFRKPMGRVLMSLVTVQRLLDGTHPCQRRRRVPNG